MSQHHSMAGATPIVMLLTLCLSGGICLAQTYELRNDVIDDGGSKLTASGYILRGSFGQPTVGKISSSGYRAIIGFWHPPYAAPTGVEEKPLVQSYVPIVFRLFQNFPNPFSHATTIRYSLPARRGDAGMRRGGDVSTYQLINLSIYDLSGRLVRTLVDEKQGAGCYKVTWDLRGVSGELLPNGVYFYRICVRNHRGTAGDPALSGAEVFIRTKKMVVLR